jgi:DNA-directed RNA polymerase specialized sigma24 family protein
VHRWSRDEPAVALGQEALAYADTLHNLARYLTGNRAAAEDLMQETYARARGGRPVRAGDPSQGWLFRILRNTWFSLARRRRVDPTVGGLDTVAPAIEPRAVEVWLRDDVGLDRCEKS